MNKKIIGSFLALSLAFGMSACGFDVISPTHSPTKGSEENRSMPTVLTASQTEAPKQTTPATTPKPSAATRDFGGKVVETADPSALSMTVGDFFRQTKEKGNDFWKGKTVVLTGKLAIKPDILLHKGIAGERLDNPFAFFTDPEKPYLTAEGEPYLLGVALTLETNNYLIENVQVGDVIQFEVVAVDYFKGDLNDPICTVAYLYGGKLDRKTLRGDSQEYANIIRVKK